MQFRYGEVANRPDLDNVPAKRRNRLETPSASNETVLIVHDRGVQKAIALDASGKTFDVAVVLPATMTKFNCRQGNRLVGH